MARASRKNNINPKRSMGYPEVERLIDSEDFSSVNEAFEDAYVELDKVARKKAGLGKGRDAKKAMKAMELTMDLLRELLALKYRLQEEAEGAAKKKK